MNFQDQYQTDSFSCSKINEPEDANMRKSASPFNPKKQTSKMQNQNWEELVHKLVQYYLAEGMFLDFIKTLTSKLSEAEKSQMSAYLKGTSLELMEEQNKKLIEEFKKKELREKKSME